MGKTRGVHETTPELRNRMVGMYEAGLGLRDIASAVNCSQRTVKRWLNRFDREGNVETRDRCGRKRATTVEQDEAIVRLATQTPITAAKAVLPALGLTCSVDTIRERLHKAGIHNWSPPRKHMQKIPLGSDADGAAIQQAVWRPTGTQLGKKKSRKEAGKGKKTRSAVKKKNTPRKIKPKDSYVGDGAPSEALKQPGVQPGFIFISQQNIQPPRNDETQPLPPPPLPPPQSLPPPDPIQFGGASNLAQQPPPIYQHPGLNVTQNWPLDLVQGSHHYPQGQPTSLAHEHPPQQQQLQELHTQQEQQQQAQQQAQQRIQEERAQQQSNTQSQRRTLDERQPHDQADHQPRQQRQVRRNELDSSQEAKNVKLDSCSNSNSSNENSQTSDGEGESSKDGSSKERGRQKNKKKGGKAKGTLETSVEIRNRMIGMSQAGLSTLSIALAINRSERTVKRWLERWHKEGNVQTKERKGRRRITTKEQDEAIVAMATQHPLTAAKYVAPALGLKCSVDTIRERLHKAGIHSWKLGKKQGEGNAVHTVHLWQPSGNRPNKPKLPGEKKRKSPGVKRNDQRLDDAPKRAPRKKKTESAPLKIAPMPANMIPEQTPMQFHNPAGTRPDIMQSVHHISVPPPTLVPSQPPPPGPQGPPPGPQPMQPMGPMMQQRPDCRLAPPIVPPVSSQGNAGVVYPSCMIGTSGHATHMEQSDSLNYEPYIWSF